jgi:hypothetical protein
VERDVSELVILLVEELTVVVVDVEELDDP